MVFSFPEKDRFEQPDLYKIQIINFILYFIFLPCKFNNYIIMINLNLIQIDIKEKEVFQLLKLEELFHSHYLTQELLNGMISLYVKFVENIHHNQHPLRIFFMEKIKFVLSRPEVVRLLEKKSIQKNQNMRQTIRGMVGVTEEDEIEIKKMAEEAKEEIRQNHFINNKKIRNYDKTDKGEQLRQKERNIKIQMQVQIMQEVEQNMLKMKKDILKKGQHQKNKEMQINKIVQKQDMDLSERLAKRRKKLRKKSVEFKEKEMVQVLEATPIAKKQLLQMKKQLNQTYERFTRLTMNKAKRATQTGKENEGRVKVTIKQTPIQQEDIFDQLQKEKAVKIQQPISFSKLKKVSHQESTPKIPKSEQLQKKKNQKQREGDSLTDSKPLDHNKGRITVRQKNYEQIEEEEIF